VAEIEVGADHPNGGMTKSYRGVARYRELSRRTEASLDQLFQSDFLGKHRRPFDTKRGVQLLAALWPICSPGAHLFLTPQSSPLRINCYAGGGGAD
jgi:hypothetical protein